MEGVRKWLVACGAAFGVREVHPYRFTDASTRLEIPYITYTPTRLIPLGVSIMNSSELDGYDVTSHSVKQVEVSLRIDLHNSELGLPFLAWCAIAAEKEQAIKDIFSQHKMAWKGLNEEIREETTFDDERLYYKQSMDVIVRSWLDYGHLNRNHLIDTVSLSPVTVE